MAKFKIGKTYAVNHTGCADMTILGFNDNNEIQVRCHAGIMDNWLAWVGVETFEEIIK